MTLRARRIAQGVFLRWRVALTVAVRRFANLGAAARTGIRRTLAAALSAAGRMLGRAFSGWRAWLTHLSGRLAAALRRVPIDGIGRAAHAWVRPSTAARLDRRDVPAAALASASLIAAAAALVAVAGWRSGPASWSYAAGVALWSAARLAVLEILASSGRIDPGAAAISWAISLPPFALGAVPGLSLPMFALAAAVNYRALISLGASQHDALRMTAWSFGGHAAGVAAATVASAVLAA